METRRVKDGAYIVCLVLAILHALWLLRIVLSFLLWLYRTNDYISQLDCPIELTVESSQPNQSRMSVMVSGQLSKLLNSDSAKTDAANAGFRGSGGSDHDDERTGERPRMRRASSIVQQSRHKQWSTKSSQRAAAAAAAEDERQRQRQEKQDLSWVMGKRMSSLFVPPVDVDDVTSQTSSGNPLDPVPEGSQQQQQKPQQQQQQQRQQQQKSQQQQQQKQQQQQQQQQQKQQQQQQHQQPKHQALASELSSDDFLEVTVVDRAGQAPSATAGVGKSTSGTTEGYASGLALTLSGCLRRQDDSQAAATDATNSSSSAPSVEAEEDAEEEKSHRLVACSQHLLSSSDSPPREEEEKM